LDEGERRKVKRCANAAQRGFPGCMVSAGQRCALRHLINAAVSLLYPVAKTTGTPGFMAWMACRTLPGRSGAGIITSNRTCNGVTVSGKHLHGLSTVESDQNPVAQRFQCGASHFADPLMILGDQNGLPYHREPADLARHAAGSQAGVTFSLTGERRETRFPGLARFHQNETAVLFHNAIDCGHPSPCPFPFPWS